MATTSNANGRKLLGSKPTAQYQFWNELKDGERRLVSMSQAFVKMAANAIRNEEPLPYEEQPAIQQMLALIAHLVDIIEREENDGDPASRSA